MIFGAGHDAIPLAKFAKQLGWIVNVIDRRPAYSTSERFPEADQVIVGQMDELDGSLYADENAVAVVMTHHFDSDREIVRRFNGLYGPVFPEPKALFTPTPKVNGIDARKMSKSYNNTIGVSESAEGVREKVMAMVTDPARVRRQDPGNPDHCNLFPFHVLYSPPDEVAVVDRECRTAARGCVDCKKHLISNMNPALEPIRQKRADLLSRPGDVVRDVLHSGDETARRVAEETMERVREAVKLSPEP
jgi:tryptophanyl-tRNA synthetase